MDVAVLFGSALPIRYTKVILNFAHVKLLLSYKKKHKNTRYPRGVDKGGGGGE